MSTTDLPSASGLAILLGVSLEDVHKMSLLAKLRALRRAAGKCPRCGEPPVPGRVKCSPCLSMDAAYSKRRTDLRLERGTCRRCPGPKAHGKTLCESCLLLHRARAITYRKTKS